MEELVMRSKLLIGFIVLAAASATASASDGSANATHWQGYVMRNGLRTPIEVDFGKWGGKLSAGQNDVALDHVQLTATRVHFEAPGEGVFDGEVVGDEMAGAISQPSGSFALTREDANDYSPYFLGP
jgi:hypothetical protein